MEKYIKYKIQNDIREENYNTNNNSNEIVLYTTINRYIFVQKRDTYSIYKIYTIFIP